MRLLSFAAMVLSLTSAIGLSLFYMKFKKSGIDLTYILIALAGSLYTLLFALIAGIHYYRSPEKEKDFTPHIERA